MPVGPRSERITWATPNETIINHPMTRIIPGPNWVQNKHRKWMCSQDIQKNQTGSPEPTRNIVWVRKQLKNETPHEAGPIIRSPRKDNRIDRKHTPDRTNKKCTLIVYVLRTWSHKLRHHAKRPENSRASGRKIKDRELIKVHQQRITSESRTGRKIQHVGD